MGKVKANAAFPSTERARMAAWKGQVPPNTFLKGDPGPFASLFMHLCHRSPWNAPHLPAPHPDTEPGGNSHGKCSGKGVAALVFLIINLSFRFEKIKKKKTFHAISRRELAKVFCLGDSGRKE